MHGVVLRRPHCWVHLKNIPHCETIWSGWIFSAGLTHKLSSVYRQRDTSVGFRTTMLVPAVKAANGAD